MKDSIAAPHGDECWQGASGRAYHYYAYELPHSFMRDQAGNFIIARRATAGQWIPMRIGYGDLGRVTEMKRHHWRNLLASGATHILVRLNRDRVDGKAEAIDLRNNYRPSIASLRHRQRNHQ